MCHEQRASPCRNPTESLRIGVLAAFAAQRTMPLLTRAPVSARATAIRAANGQRGAGGGGGGGGGGRGGGGGGGGGGAHEARQSAPVPKTLSFPRSPRSTASA